MTVGSKTRIMVVGAIVVVVVLLSGIAVIIPVVRPDCVQTTFQIQFAFDDDRIGHND